MMETIGFRSSFEGFARLTQSFCYSVSAGALTGFNFQGFQIIKVYLVSNSSEGFWGGSVLVGSGNLGPVEGFWQF